MTCRVLPWEGVPTPDHWEHVKDVVAGSKMAGRVGSTAPSQRVSSRVRFVIGLAQHVRFGGTDSTAKHDFSLLPL